MSLAKKTIDNARINILKAYDVKSANELIRLCILDDIYTPRTNKEIIDELEDHKQAVYLRRITRLT
jgi:hypothetical protein